jgi:ribosome-interacting GTPase 1
MPANLPAEWYLVEEEYRKTKELSKKIELLKKLISVTPKHKGTENLLADLRKKLSRLEDEMERKSRKARRKAESIKKTGDLLVSIIGLTQSGKSTLLKNLTNASVEISSVPYTTKEPVTGVCLFEGVSIQLVEIPSFFLRKHMTIAHSSDLILLLVREEKDSEKLFKVLEENNLTDKKRIVWPSSCKDYQKLLNEILKECKIVRIFAKPVGKPAESKPIVMKEGSSIKDFIERINKNWLKTFKFARIFDDSKFSGRKVGLEYLLKDKDTVEVHA